MADEKVETQKTHQEVADAIYGDKKDERQASADESKKDDKPDDVVADKSDQEAADTSTDSGSDQNDDKKEEEKKPEEKEQGLKVPDGVTFDASRVDEIAAFAKAQGLSQQQAQALLDRTIEQEKSSVSAVEKARTDAVAKYLEAIKPGGEQWKKMESDWRAESLADKEIGGNEKALAENAEYAKRFVEANFSKEVKNFFHETALGSNKFFIRDFAKLGRKMFAKGMETGDTTPPAKKKSAADLLYGPGTEVGAQQPKTN